MLNTTKRHLTLNFYTLARRQLKGRTGFSHNVNECKSFMHNYIGPPDKVSNIRPIVRVTPPEINSIEMRLHEKQIEVEKWNHDFWTRHNNRFYEGKAEFLSLCKENEDKMSADKLSEFYKHFLEKNKKLHFYYNLSWYMKNFDLLVMEMQVKIKRLLNKIKK